MYFHTDELAAINIIASVALEAHKQGQRLRIDVDGNGNLRIKRGEGVWSPPFSSTNDPYRDNSPEQRPALYVGDHGEPVVRALDESMNARDRQ